MCFSTPSTSIVRVAHASTGSVAAPLSVVIPARNEAAYIDATLRSWTQQQRPDGTPLAVDDYELVVVANNCTDATVARTVDYARQHPQLQLTVLDVGLPAPRANVGNARLVGSEYVLARCTGPGGQLFYSDADTLAGDTLVHHLQRVFARPRTAGVGARLSTGAAALGHYHAAFIRYEQALQRHIAHREGRIASHGYFSGAGMGITRAAYRDIGGIRPLSFNEDKQLRADLESRDHHIIYSDDCVVHTSCRQVGRVGWGMSKQLAYWSRCEMTGSPLLVPHPGHAITGSRLKRAVRRLRRGDTQAWQALAADWWRPAVAHRYLRSVCNATFYGEAVQRVWHCPNFVQKRNRRFPELPVAEASQLLAVPISQWAA